VKKTGLLNVPGFVLVKVLHEESDKQGISPAAYNLFTVNPNIIQIAAAARGQDGNVTLQTSTAFRPPSRSGGCRRLWRRWRWWRPALAAGVWRGRGGGRRAEQGPGFIAAWWLWRRCGGGGLNAPAAGAAGAPRGTDGVFKIRHGRITPSLAMGAAVSLRRRASSSSAAAS